ncbi:MAG: WD40-repeat-containing domain protein, partial [Olpidium bornovanus]
MLTVKEDWEEEERKREEESVREQRRSQRGRRRRRRGRRRAGSSADSASSRSSFASEEDPAPTPPAPPSAGAEAPSSGKAPPLLMELAEHEAAVTCLYREGATLVTGSADKTMRQWDLAAGGKCVLSMDVLWTMSAPPSSLSSFLAPSPGPPTLPRSASGSAWAGVAPWEPAAIGDDHGAGGFVGALQFWGSALACGTADGAIRMWDLRTGQAHRTLQGHAAGVTSLGFDAVHVVSGSFDRTVR